jgi:hypothetical protein
MIVRSVLAAPSVSSPYESWHRYFLEKSDSLPVLPWPDSYLLCPAERNLVVRSIQQFQVGEWARGRGLVRRASSHPVLSPDKWFLSSLELFILEEQRHSGMLARFLDHEGIPRLGNHWVNRVFRGLRKLAGLELCAMVLVTAEVLAVPFYKALGDATRSPLLRSICARILRDEAAHLNFQALTLGVIRRPLSITARALRSHFHSMVFCCTALAVWQQHRSVFRGAGWGFRRFWSQAHRVFARLQRQIRRIASNTSSCIPVV